MAKLPDTMTAAVNGSGVVFINPGRDRTDSSARVISYAERYRGSSAVMKTPIQHLQELADEAEAEKADQ